MLSGPGRRRIYKLKCSLGKDKGERVECVDLENSRSVDLEGWDGSL